MENIQYLFLYSNEIGKSGREDQCELLVAVKSNGRISHNHPWSTSSHTRDTKTFRWLDIIQSSDIHFHYFFWIISQLTKRKSYRSERRLSWGNWSLCTELIFEITMRSLVKECVPLPVEWDTRIPSVPIHRNLWDDPSLPDKRRQRKRMMEWREEWEWVSVEDPSLWYVWLGVERDWGRE